jgi:hypothetical protein
MLSANSKVAREAPVELPVSGFLPGGLNGDN